MMKINKIYLLIIFLVLIAVGCKESVPLNRDTFTNLLVEMHLVDAVLSEGKRNNVSLSDKKNYSYYSDIFNRYGISRSDFDTCVSFYSRDNRLYDAIYSSVEDSLNKRLTRVKMQIADFKKNDTVNLLDVNDTIWINGWTKDTTLTLSELKTGKYQFEFGMKLDSSIGVLRGKVVSYFLRNYSIDTIYYVDSVWNRKIFLRLDSVLDEQEASIKVDSLYTYERRQDSFIVQETRLRVDTFKIRSINLAGDTTFHQYSWTYFIDSTFGSFVTKFIVDDKVAADTVVPFYGYATKVGLCRQYLPKSKTREQQRDFDRKLTSNAVVSLGSESQVIKKEVLLVHDTLQ